MMLTEQELEIEEAALAFAKKNKSSITKRLTDKAIYLPEQKPVSVFMAGSPGAGKTEASLELFNDLASEIKILRIDPDELRYEFPQYSGDNSYLFQKAVSVLVDRIHDLALDQKQSLVQVDLLLKDINNGNRSYKANIDQVDNHIPEKYTAAELERELRN